MKKKKLPIWASLLLVALYLFFGMGNKVPEAAEPVIPAESITVQAPETVAPSRTFTIPAEFTVNVSILPAEMQKTNVDELSMRFASLPECVNPIEESEKFREELLKLL